MRIPSTSDIILYPWLAAGVPLARAVGSTIPVLEQREITLKHFTWKEQQSDPEAPGNMSTNVWTRNGQNLTQSTSTQQPIAPSQTPNIPPFNAQEVRECLKNGYIDFLNTSTFLGYWHDHQFNHIS